MSVFLIKTLSIAIRSLARPLISYFTYYNRLKLLESNSFFSLKIRDGLTYLGQKFHYYNIILNRRVFKLSNLNTPQPLSTDKALERGAELVSEIIVYSILLTIPTLEIIKSYKKSKYKEEKSIQNIVNMRNDLDKIIRNNYEIKKDLNEISHLLKIINDNIFVV